MMTGSIRPYVLPGAAPGNGQSIDICIIYCVTTKCMKGISSVEPESSSTSTNACVVPSTGKVREEQPTFTVLPHALLFNALHLTKTIWTSCTLSGINVSNTSPVQAVDPTFGEC